jgi:hypothetical protein
MAERLGVRRADTDFAKAKGKLISRAKSGSAHLKS